MSLDISRYFKSREGTRPQFIGGAPETTGITATDLDIRDLDSATDSVSIVGSSGGADVTISLSEIDIRELSDMVRDTVIELRLISYLLSEGLNVKEDLEQLREDLDAEY